MAKPFSKEIELSVYFNQDKKCCNCGKKLNLKIDRPDHIIPQSKMNIKIYGEELIYSKENCQIPCFHCHQQKGTWSMQKRRDLIQKWEKYSRSKLKKFSPEVVNNK